MYVADATADAIQNEFGEATWARGTSCEVICKLLKQPTHIATTHINTHVATTHIMTTSIAITQR